MTQMLDYTRHMEIFDPTTFNEQVHILGAGATGSWLALQLAKLGVQDIHVYDFDIIEEHNIPNQLFGIHDIGRPKVEALADFIKHSTGMDITVHNEAFPFGKRVSGYVFAMIDTMSGRKAMWEKSIKMKMQVKLYIEPRMGIDGGRVYAINPMEYRSFKPYEETFYGDEETEVSACGASMSVITSALATSAWCVRQLIERHAGRDLDHEVLLDYKYNNVIATRWG